MSIESMPSPAETSEPTTQHTSYELYASLSHDFAGIMEYESMGKAPADLGDYLNFLHKIYFYLIHSRSQNGSLETMSMTQIHDLADEMTMMRVTEENLPEGVGVDFYPGTQQPTIYSKIEFNQYKYDPYYGHKKIPSYMIKWIPFDQHLTLGELNKLITEIKLTDYFPAKLQLPFELKPRKNEDRRRGQRRPRGRGQVPLVNVT